MAAAKKTGAPPIKLNDLSGVISEIESLYREAKSGKRKPSEVSKLVYVLREIRETLAKKRELERDDWFREMEAQVTALAERIGARK